MATGSKDYTLIYQHKFYVNTLTLTTEKEYDIDPTHIGLMQFEYDYLNRRLPIIKMSISLTDEQALSIGSHLDSAKMAIEIVDKYIDGDGNVIKALPFIKDTFDIIPGTGTDDILGTSTSQYEEDPNFTIMLIYLIKRDRVQWLDKEIATIFKNTDKAAALQALFSMRDIPAKTCMITPPVVNEEIENLVLPMGNVVANIDTINIQYGLWSSDAIVFDDYTYLYCIDKNDPNIIINTVSEYDTVMFKMPDSENPAFIAYGSNEDAENKCHYVNLAMNPSIEDNTATTTQTEFGTITSVDNNGTVKKYTVDESSPKMKFVRANNDLTVERYANKLANTIRVIATVTDCSLNIFKPYKNYRFEVEETDAMYDKLSAKIFRISLFTATLTKKQDYFESNATIQLSVVDTTSISTL